MKNNPVTTSHIAPCHKQLKVLAAVYAAFDLIDPIERNLTL